MKRGIGAILLLALAVFLGKQFFSTKVPDPHDWMARQIGADFAPFQGVALSQKKISGLAADPACDSSLFIHYSIRKNIVTNKHRIPEDHPLAKECLYPRIRAIHNSLQQTVRKYPLPDMDFVVSIHDALMTPAEVPIFVMAKVQDFSSQILIPDFEALRGRYQVLKGQDITKDRSIPVWEERKGQLIWRGGPGQHLPTGCTTLSLNPQEPHCLTRVKLCDLSDKYPDRIDARFTYLEESYRSLAPFVGGFVPFEAQIQYKYHMQIDGYSCAYSTSGWKLFAGSLLFKEDSNHIQWYSHELKPYVHYIPVKEGLFDLLDQIDWALAHDSEAKQIAAQARSFALSHITEDLNRLYLYHALLAYSKLNWVD